MNDTKILQCLVDTLRQSVVHQVPMSPRSVELLLDEVERRRDAAYIDTAWTFA